MSEEMRIEAMELSVTACEKYSQNNELAARMVKESMDKKFGPAFHVVVGESYGFEITYECTTICYMYFGGNQAICIWKCSWNSAGRLQRYGWYFTVAITLVYIFYLSGPYGYPLGFEWDTCAWVICFINYVI